MLTLVLDSSASLATAVVADDLDILAVRSERGSTLSLLHDLTREALLGSGRKLADVDLVAAVRGPGSWTGLHVGVTTAKTLAQVLDRPLVGLSMLDCLAHSAPVADGTVCALVDAKHDAYYSAFHTVSDGAVGPLRDGGRRSLPTLVELLREVGGEVTVVGGLSEPHHRLLETDSGVRLNATSVRYPTAEAFAAVALAGRGTALAGEERHGMAPDYMQDDFTISSRK